MEEDAIAPAKKSKADLKVSRNSKVNTSTNLPRLIPLNQSYDHQGDNIAHGSNFFEDSFPNSARQGKDQSFNVELNTSEQYTVDDSDVKRSKIRISRLQSVNLQSPKPVGKI